MPVKVAQAGKSRFAVEDLSLPVWTRYFLPSSPASAFWAALLACLSVTYLVYGLALLTGMTQRFPVFGQDGYFELARSLLQGDGFVFEPGGTPPHHRPPLYPVVLMPIAVLPDALLLPGLILVHSLMIGCVGFLIFTIAHRMFGRTTASVAVVLFLLNPWLYASVKNPLSPVLQCLLYATYVFVIGREVIPALCAPLAAKATFPAWLLIGSLCGLLTLTHGTLIAASGSFLIILAMWSARQRDFELLKTAAAAGLVAVVVVAPWTYRNWATFDRFIPVVGGAGLMYWHQERQWSPNAGRGSGGGPVPGSSSHEMVANAPQRFNGVTSETLDNELTARALRNVKTRPGLLFKGFALGAIAYYFPSVAELLNTGGTGYGSPEQLAVTGLYLTAWILAAVGFLRRRRQVEARWKYVLLVLCIFLYAVWYFPFLTFTNHTMYSFATTPILALLAATGVVAVLGRLRTLE